VYAANPFTLGGATLSPADQVWAVNPTAGGGSITATIGVGGYPEGIAVSPTGSHVGDVYVSNANLTTFASTVAVIDPGTNAVIDTINVPDGAGPVAISPIGPEAGYVYVAGDDTVSVIS
jgi:DNA-binding beta-propeller fold protein YncE